MPPEGNNPVRRHQTSGYTCEPSWAPRGPSTDVMHTSPPASPRTFANVVSSTTPPTIPRIFVNVVPGTSPARAIGTPSPKLISPFPIEVLTLPSGPVVDLPTTSAQAYSTVTESERTDSDASEHTRSRHKTKTPPPPTEENIRDRSPLRPNEKGIDSSSDSSGKSPTSDASVDVPSTTHPEVMVEPPPLPPVSVDRRPLYVRYSEYQSPDPQFALDKAVVIQCMEQMESLTQCGSHNSRQDAFHLTTYEHLKLDYNIAVDAVSVFDQTDPRLAELEDRLNVADEAMTVFELAHPELVPDEDKSVPQPD